MIDTMSNRTATSNTSPSPQFRLDILIPTFNRERDLAKNLDALTEEIARHGLGDRVKILVGDNASVDGTPQVLERHRRTVSAYRNTGNIGLEANAVKLLGLSDADYIMYLGDDDFLPSGHLSLVTRILDRHDVRFAAIICGYSELHTDGRIVPSRGRVGDAPRVRCPGFATDLTWSPFAHQLSGLVLRRQGLHDSYLRAGGNRNIYLFIALLLEAMRHGPTCFLPGQQVLVSQGNSKDWRYNEVMLLDVMLKNYRHRYGDHSMRAALGLAGVMLRQPWRTGAGLSEGRNRTVFVSLLSHKHIPAHISGLAILIHLLFALRRAAKGLLAWPKR